MMLFPEREKSRILIVYHKDGHFPTESFILINENLCLAELGNLIFCDIVGLSAQYLIYENKLQRALAYLNSLRYLGIRHTTIKPSKQRYDAVVETITENFSEKFK